MNDFVQFRSMILGAKSSRGVVVSATSVGYSVATDTGTKNFVSSLVLKIGDEVSILENGSIQPADDGLIFFV